jgi:cellulose synthase/poly-beta-1,6-N-acetylglucosamine synthase-like glycosyltransferase
MAFCVNESGRWLFRRSVLRETDFANRISFETSQFVNDYSKWKIQDWWKYLHEFHQVSSRKLVTSLEHWEYDYWPYFLHVRWQGHSGYTLLLSSYYHHIIIILSSYYHLIIIILSSYYHHIIISLLFICLIIYILIKFRLPENFFCYEKAACSEQHSI